MAMAVGRAARSLRARLGRVPWAALRRELDRDGYARTPILLTARECTVLAGLYDDGGTRFRSTIVMQRHGFGAGEYRYFDYPLPPLVQVLRETVYGELVEVANDWCRRLRAPSLYPSTLEGFLAACAAAGQKRPTPLLLRYAEGDYNCLHRDLYGALAFPVQLTVLLSTPGTDFEGGEFVLVEQRARRQSRAVVVPLARGQGVLFTVDARPVAGARGDYRAAMRHGVSSVRAGSRLALGVIFHDAA